MISEKRLGFKTKSCGKKSLQFQLAFGTTVNAPYAESGYLVMNRLNNFRVLKLMDRGTRFDRKSALMPLKQNTGVDQVLRIQGKFRLYGLSLLTRVL